MMNREKRRKYFKLFKKMLGFLNWQEYNETQIKQRPYVNKEKRAKKGIV